MSAREAYMAMLYNGPLVPADAMVVLSGDGVVRLDTAVGLLRQGAAHWVIVSGGLDDPPHSLTAEKARDYLVSKGLAEHRIILEGESQNTHEQAEAVADICRATLDTEDPWRRVLVIASAYHLPRAFLTCIQSFGDTLDPIALVPVPAYANWGRPPDGLETPRVDLLADEFAKIDEYQARGHVASYEDGIAYLRELEDDPN